MHASDGETLDPPAAVVETHISTLFFVGDWVYKAKKAVQLPFVDLTDVNRREQLCAREVDLNRRLAPDVYLGVAHLVGPGDGDAEPLVAMRRLPEGRRLSTLIRGREFDLDGTIEQLARLLADFHASAERSDAIDRAGTVEAIATRVHDLLDEIAPQVGTVLDPAVVAEVDRRFRDELTARAALFRDRIAQGMICDGHGDLQADDVFCLDDGPRVLDCVEFDDDLRHLDVADDLAFLVMDLTRLGAPELGDRLLHAYERAAGTHLPRHLVDFYAAYRALVRCMVACTRAAQTEGAAAEEAAARAADLLLLCVRLLRRSVPVLVLVGGLPGTGKTTVARALAEDADHALFRSDVVRKELAGLEPSARAGAEPDAGLYRPETTDRVYEELASRAARELTRGRTTVIDATFTDQRHREAFREVGLAARARVVELRCVLDPVVAASRLRQRAETGDDASDATPEIAARLGERFDPWPEATEFSTVESEVVIGRRARSFLQARRHDVDTSGV